MFEVVVGIVLVGVAMSLMAAGAYLESKYGANVKTEVAVLKAELAALKAKL